jgi:hypothetical protein
MRFTASQQAPAETDCARAQGLIVGGKASVLRGLFYLGRLHVALQEHGQRGGNGNHDDHTEYRQTGDNRGQPNDFSQLVSDGAPHFHPPATIPGPETRHRNPVYGSGESPPCATMRQN